MSTLPAAPGVPECNSHARRASAGRMTRVSPNRHRLVIRCSRALPILAASQAPFTQRGYILNKAADFPLDAMHADDVDHNTSGNTDFQAVLDARLSRRSVLRGGVGTAATAVLGGWSLAAC
ncbi:MAG: hypothetical protein V4750_09320, partial [Pseudomonadota bacterium]